MFYIFTSYSLKDINAGDKLFQALEENDLATQLIFRNRKLSASCMIGYNWPYELLPFQVSKIQTYNGACFLNPRLGINIPENDFILWRGNYSFPIC